MQAAQVAKDSQQSLAGLVCPQRLCLLHVSLREPVVSLHPLLPLQYESSSGKKIVHEYTYAKTTKLVA